MGGVNGSLLFVGLSDTYLHT